MALCALFLAGALCGHVAALQGAPDAQPTQTVQAIPATATGQVEGSVPACAEPEGQGAPNTSPTSTSRRVGVDPPPPGVLSGSVGGLVEREIAEQRIPGLALGVFCDGEILKAEGYGLANIELDVPATQYTIFQTGSVGKQFTATAIMMLVEEGKLRLDDHLSKYLAGTPAAWKEVSIRNLLTHTSGIADYTDDADKPGGLINLRTDYTEDQLFQKLIRLPLKFQPGEKWEYSNTGYVLLGFVIHKVTGEFYGDFLQERIFKPLDMQSTRIISESDIVRDRAAGYELVKGEIKNQQWVSPSLNTTADGALYTNVMDMAHWDAALYTEKLLKKSSLEQMWTPVTLRNGKHWPYGFGWEITDVKGHQFISHDGAWQGFTMSIFRFLDDRLTVVVFTNLDSEHSDPAIIAYEVARVYIPALPAPGRKKAAQ